MKLRKWRKNTKKRIGKLIKTHLKKHIQSLLKTKQNKTQKNINEDSKKGVTNLGLRGGVTVILS